MLSRKTGEDHQNINVVKGLIQDYFTYSEPSLLGHGPGLALDLENSLKRSKSESARYEFKQGVLNLEPNRKENKKLYEDIAKTMCAIANIGPNSKGYLYIGVTESKRVADRIFDLYNIDSIPVGHVFVHGVDHEARELGLEVENYIQKIVSNIFKTDLSEPLRTQVLSSIENINYKGRTVIRLLIPAQQEISWVGNETFKRQDANTIKAEGREIMAITKLFGTP